MKMDPSVNTDGQLLERYVLANAHEAFGELVRRHGPMVLATCRRICADDADDATQTVFVVLIRKASSLMHLRDLGPWLYRTAINVCAHVLRQRQRRQTK